MEHREKLVIQLYKILDKNTNDVRIYYRIADKGKRAFIKNFFRKLSYQKRIFCRRIRFEIKELEAELHRSDTDKSKSFFPTFQELPAFNANMTGLIKYCYKRELEYLLHYKSLLSQTHLGSIREMLINQKHAVQQVLNELKTIESTIQQGKNEGEVNYL